KLHKGSIIVADNAGIFAEDMKEYLNYVRSSGKYSSRYVPMGNDGLEISILKKIINEIVANNVQKKADGPSKINLDKADSNSLCRFQF
ncbi:MAG: hypothetical protein QG670_551, partial [Thermoproteota archaeon]|nr:hypothetical protein [Thermoproteota archaeon]